MGKVRCRRKTTGCQTNAFTSPTLGETMVTHGSFLSSISTIFSLKASKFILLTHGHLGGDSIFLDIYTHILKKYLFTYSE